MFQTSLPSAGVTRARPDATGDIAVGDDSRHDHEFLVLRGARIAPPAAAQQVQLGSGSVVATVTRLKAGQYVWAPRAAPEGPLLLIVNISAQRALLFRNGVPIGATTVSTGKPGHGTPTGIFTVLQKQVEHYSSKYDSAPMPYMQRLTWYGVALHAGNLPGYPASHGCIRLPNGLCQAALRRNQRRHDRRYQPRQSDATHRPGAANPRVGCRHSASPGAYEWHPEKSPEGPVSIVVSGADRKAVVLRNGVEIASAGVTIDGPVSGAWAYSLRDVDASGQHWIRVPLRPKARRARWSRPRNGRDSTRPTPLSERSPNRPSRHDRGRHLGFAGERRCRNASHID